MSKNWKPEGYNSVSPYLLVKNAKDVIEFLKATFGATELRKHERPDGSVMHVEVRIDDTVVMMGEAGADWPIQPTHIHVYVNDVDAIYKRALTAGGVSVQAPVQKEDPDKRGAVNDPSGHTWWIASQVG